MHIWTPAENPKTRPVRSWVFDIGCAVFAFAVSDLAHFTFGAAGSRHSAAIGLIVAVLTALALPLRRVWPGPVFLWTVGVAAVLAEWPIRGALFPAALGISLYAVATKMTRAQALAAAAMVAGVVFTVVGQNVLHNGWSAENIGVTCGYAVVPTAAVLVAGLYVSTRRDYLTELRDRAQRLERERDQNSALAAAAERARIAREMHDSVAHHLTVIVALSDGAVASVDRAPAQAADAIRDVSSTARQALAETRRLLGVLRDESGSDLRQPLPGMADLDDLLRRVRAAGLPVSYERSGQAADLPSGLQLAVFRLVQEALTNTMKHAGPEASATVRLQLTPDEVRVDVDDDGAGSAGAAPAAGGGLTGMRERVSAFGGELDCGPRQPRGWRVTARLRLDGAATP